MIFKLAWKNLWRTPRRSLTVMGSMVLGVWALVFIISFYSSFTKTFTRSSIQYEYSHMQVHNPLYLQEPAVDLTLSTDQDLSTLLNDQRVASYSMRQKVEGMLASSRSTRGVQIYGIQPKNEAQTTFLEEQLLEGSYFRKIRRNPIVISAEGAEKLSVGVRSKLVLTFQDIDREMVSAAFRVEGIFESASPRINNSVVYVRHSDLARLIGTDRAHELGVMLKREEDISQFQKEFSAYTRDTVQNFRELAPEFHLMEESSAMTQRTMVVIIMLALFFGIINIMLMAVLERTREIGMLRAIGMHRRKVFVMILLETCLLGAVSGPIGVLLGFITVSWLSRRGLDLSRYSEALKSYGYDTVFYPEIDSIMYPILMGVVLLTALLGAIYPSVMAVRLNPLKAIRKI